MASDYARIERALAFIAANVADQPDLDQVAGELGLSPHHFQRLFTRWVGVSPKKFLQYLTLERAKTVLEESASVLDAAHEAGLSGPSRLHDLFLSHEAVTPGEWKRRGEGLTIAYGFADSPFGEALIFTTPRGICALGFVGDGGREACLADLAGRWRQARLVEDGAAVGRLGEAIFRAPGSQGEKLHLVLYGSPFQIKVWEALLQVPAGALVAYEDLARQVSTPKGSRAVGSAVGDNPISYLIPCHRVIRKTGQISHYHWGRARKMALIGWEAAMAELPAAAPASALRPPSAFSLAPPARALPS